MLLSQAWEKYCSVNDRWSDAGRKNYFRFIEWMKEDKDISDISIDTALEFLGQYRQSAGKTFNNYKSALSMVWKTLIPYSNIRVNPWINIQNRSAESDFYRPITSTEYKKILGATKGFWRDATIIAYYTGLRRKDIQILQWSQIHPDHIELIPAKTSANQKSVFIPLHKEVQKILQNKKCKKKYVFPVEAEKLTNGGFNHEYSVILSGLGITAKSPAIVGFHSLRASFITRCEESGIDRQTIQGIVGHGSPLMTARYSHDTESAKKILAIE